MSALRAVVTILGKDLRLRLRDRSAFVIGVAAPLVLAAILSQILGDVGGSRFDARFAVVDHDGGEAAAALPDQIRDVPGVTVDEDLTESQARSRVDHGDLDAAFVIPEGFTAAVQAGRSTGLEVIGNVDARLSTEIATSIADRYAGSVDATRLSIAIASSDGPDSGLIAAAQRQAPPLRVEQLPASDRQLDTTTYLTAGLGVLFLFFLVQVGVLGLLEEQREGTLARLLIAPIPPLVIPVAKALTSVVLGVTGLTVLVVVSSVAMDADWGDPLAVAVLIVAVVLAAVSTVTLVAGVARTPEQASTATAVVAIVMGLFGGSLFPVNRGFLARLAVLTPHHWFLRGLGDGLAGGVGDVLGSVAALLAFTAAVGGTGAVLLLRGGWRR